MSQSSPFLGRNSSSSRAGVNVMEVLQSNLDLFTDFATIRIYWKFYDDKRLEQPSENAGDPRKLKKAYFIYINKSQQIIEIDKNDLKTVFDFCSQQIKDNRLINNLAM